MIRHLGMHVLPRKSGMWRRGVAHVAARLSQFTGRRLVSVAVDRDTDSAADVDRAFGGAVEIREVANDSRQEMVSFPWLMGELIPLDGITLYCHAKGCTHPPGAASHMWCDAMASACLDYPEMTAFIMQRKRIAGAFRSTQQVGLSAASFHFAGTWWWVDNAELRTREWMRSDPEFWGAESYPGLHFTRDESACLFFDHAETGHLYNPGWWGSRVGPVFSSWRAMFAEKGIQPMVDPVGLWCDEFRGVVGCV